MNQHGISPDEIVPPPMSPEAEIDLARDTQRFEQQMVDDGDDDGYAATRALTRALFAENPKCGICDEIIADHRVASAFQPTGAKAFLLCTRGECHVKALSASLTRYLGRPLEVKKEVA
jgi:hypothetical protein